MKYIRILLLIALLTISFTSCSEPDNPNGDIEPEQNHVNTQDTTQDTTDPNKNLKYNLEGETIENIITYFNEVCLDAEFINSGNPTLVQKWNAPIKYFIHGQYTDEDISVLNNFVSWLNKIDGFPGMYPSQNASDANMQIYFTDQQGMVDILGDNFYGLDGGTTFWYNDNNEIYTADICYRTDIDQITRNSVILEEIYNCLGPIQDTDLRLDSIIYSGFSTPQELTKVDQLILKLLYHPNILCGMNSSQCENIIREIFQ